MTKPKKRQKTPVVADSTHSKKTDSSTEIFGTTISGTRKKVVLAKLWLQRKELLHVATVNSEFVMEARRNPRFASMLAHCFTVADSWGIVWASRILHDLSVDRLSGMELVAEILVHANEHHEKVFLLGGADGVAERAALEMAKKYPGAQLAWFAGAETVRVERGEEASMTIAKINAFEPDYLLVAYGSPWQDIWIEENRQYLRVRVAMGVGGAFDEWAHTVAVCPEWLDALGLKWLWRLVTEPKRFPRIVKVFQYGGLVLYHKLID